MRRGTDEIHSCLGSSFRYVCRGQFTYVGHVCRPFVDLLQSLFAEWRRSIAWMRDWGCGCSTKWAGSRIPTKSIWESLEMWPTSCALSSFQASSDGPRISYSVASFALEN